MNKIIILHKKSLVRYLRYYIQLTASLILVFLLFLRPVNSQDPLKRFIFENERKKSVSMPFKLVNNLIIIPLIINDSNPLNFILDTGLTTTLLTGLDPNDSLTLTYAREIQLSGLGQGPPLSAMHSYGNNIMIRNIIGRNQDIYIVPENVFNLSARLGMQINGILGYLLFSNFIVEIDYSKKIIRFNDPDQFTYRRKHRKYKSIPLIIRDTKPYIPMTVDDSTGNSFDIKVLFDTGASHSLWIAEETLENFSIPQKNRHVFLGYGLNGEVMGIICRAMEISIGEYSIKNPVISIPDRESITFATGMEFRNGSIGSEVLKRFNMIIDYQNNQLKIRPNNNFKKPFSQNLSGMEIIAPYHSLPTYIVDHISENSPAWNAGIRAGDEIASINGIVAGKLELTEIYNILQSRPGRKIILRIFRKGEVINISFRLEEFI